MKIYGFYHICLINHYQQIIEEQINCLLESKLYEYSEEIYLGVVGEQNKYNELLRFLNKYPKLKVKAYSPDINKYEYLTLKLVQEHCKTNDCYCYYIHTKGCNYPNHTGGDHWRAYMDYFIITKWQKNIKKLKFGYDTCGVKLISARQSPAYRTHYSGNFWWANSDYIKLLKDIDFLDTKNRYEAEFWIGGSFPIAATLCQKFVDYNNICKFNPINYE